MNAEDVARLLLMYAVVPLWIVAGTFDWACHRRTQIESTSGLPENAFHWVLLAEGGLALLAVVLLEVNAGVMLVVFAAFLAHEFTTYVELRYTFPRRPIRPFEQMVHSFMELSPLVLLALLAVLRWDEARALFALGEPDLGLRLKAQSWPASYLLGLAAAVGVFNLLPMAEESWRCMRERRRVA